MGAMFCLRDGGKGEGGAAKETVIIGCHGDGIKVKLCMSMEHRSIVTADCTLISSYNRSMYM